MEVIRQDKLFKVLACISLLLRLITYDYQPTVPNQLSAQAKASPRLRMAYDLRNSAEDNSQRMLNTIELGTEIPIHRHCDSSETIICVRGHFQECLYDDNGNLTEVIDMLPGCVIVKVPIGQRHSLKSLESGTVLLEAKDGKWDAMKEEDIWKL